MKERLAYNLEFDTPQNPDIIENLRTHIGERLNVIESTQNFRVINKRIYSQNGKEPFLDVIKRGRDYRRNCESPVDFKREDAEVTGFEKIEEFLTDSKEGTIVVSFSPPGQEGSIYKQNFYDIFTKTREGVKLSRYSSVLSSSEYAKFMLEMGFEGNGEIADDAFLISNPIKIDDPRFKTPEDLHRYLHKKHEYITKEEFEERIRLCLPLILDYANNPTPQKYNAILNLADMPEKTFLSLESLAAIPVRQVMTGCGVSKAGGVFSVSEFGVGNDKYGERTFKCPECGLTNVRPENKLISKCQHCGSSKVAC